MRDASAEGCNRVALRGLGVNEVDGPRRSDAAENVSTHGQAELALEGEDRGVHRVP